MKTIQKSQAAEFKPRGFDGDSGTLRPRRVVIIGGGYAGAATAIKLLDAAVNPLRLTIVEPRADLGRGLAYSTREPNHLMNGPAKLFSLHPERPEHFAQYLARFGTSWGWRDPQTPDYLNAFAPRSVFGDYVSSELSRATARAGAKVSVDHIAAKANDIRRRNGQIEVALSNGQIVPADHVILATGAVPADPDLPIEEAVKSSRRYLPDPWDLEAYERLPRNGKVLLLGTGLTMLDVLVTLERRGFTGSYLAISRRGLLVPGRREVSPARDFLAEAPLPTTARGLLRAARRELARSTQTRADWQSLVPAIRPHVTALWQRASDTERARFLRHLRQIWETSLHRAPPRSAQLRERGREEGWFVNRAGRILALTAAPKNQVAATIQWRGKSEPETVFFDAVVNCTGASHDWSRSHSTVVTNLLASGLVRQGPFSLGIDADGRSAVIGRDGIPADDFSVIGPPLRGVRWESNSLIELLEQAIQLAYRINALPAIAEPGRLIAAQVG